MAKEYSGILARSADVCGTPLEEETGSSGDRKALDR